MTTVPYPAPPGLCNPTTTTVETDCNDRGGYPTTTIGVPGTLPVTGAQETAALGLGSLTILIGLATLMVGRRGR